MVMRTETQVAAMSLEELRAAFDEGPKLRTTWDLEIVRLSYSSPGSGRFYGVYIDEGEPGYGTYRDDQIVSSP